MMRLFSDLTPARFAGNPFSMLEFSKEHFTNRDFPLFQDFP